ncbi:hypothetical protein A3F06_00310 [candidate division TM6 bacterium RIFCSPHIGHO2_12_FULL_36_22]|nr:MAG: hypothetical protein A3F06_00310 [candidate division TM6 bacterium RIFCSPHIGHO2_12_FULL_36_22]
MKLYKLDSEGNPSIHAGDIYEHSIWTYYAMVELFETNSLYVQGLHLSIREKEVVCLAALLHDIGKIGRKNLFDKTHPRLHYDIIKNDDGSIQKIIYYQDHQEHTYISFKYAAQPLLRPNDPNIETCFCINQKTGQLYPFNINLLYKELCLTIQEQQIFTILLGMHYEFGNLKHNKIEIPEFFQMLQNFVTIVNYNNGVIDENILRLSILIQVADVKGLVPVIPRKTPLFPEEKFCCSVHPVKFDNPFQAFDYVSETSNGIQSMHKLMDYYKTTPPN